MSKNDNEKKPKFNYLEIDESNLSETNLIIGDIPLIQTKDIEEKNNIITKIITSLKIQFKKDKCEIIKYIFVIILMIITIIFYYSSLEGCAKPEQECMNTIGAEFFLNRAIDVIISAIIGNIIFSMTLNKKIKWYFSVFLIIFLIINFLIFRGMDLREHGFFNSIAFIISTPFLLLIYQLLIYIYRKATEKKYIPIIILLIIIIIPSIYIYYRVKTDCKLWGYGLGGKRLEELESKDKNACYIKYPERCYKTLFDNKLDFTKMTFYSCESMRNFKDKLVQYKGEGFKNVIDVAYPITTKWPVKDLFIKNFINRNIKEMYDLNDKNNIKNKKEKPEVTLHFNEDGTVNVSIKITPNETLIKERSELYKKSKHKFKNIIMCYFDALGREHFFRKMKKSAEFLNNYYWDNKNKKKKISSYQFFKYQNFAGWTDKNVYPMYYGTPFMVNGTHFIKNYREAGYITARTNNLCSVEVFPLYDWNYETLKGIEFDHEHYGLFCDPNFIEPAAPFSSLIGCYSFRRKCSYGTDSFNHIFKYGLEFLKAYKDQPKVLHIALNDAHESSGETIYYLDEPFKNFLSEVIEKYFDDESIIIFLSDHGNAMPDINYLLKSQDAEYERFLGTLFFFLPDNFNKLNFTALKINEQRLITPYDIRATLLDFVYVNDDKNIHSKKGQPLDVEVNGLKRNCASYYPDFYKDGKIDYACRCFNFTKDIVTE